MMLSRPSTMSSGSWSSSSMTSLSNSSCAMSSTSAPEGFDEGVLHEAEPVVEVLQDDVVGALVVLDDSHAYGEGEADVGEGGEPRHGLVVGERERQLVGVVGTFLFRGGERLDDGGGTGEFAVDERAVGVAPELGRRILIVRVR